MSDDRKYKKLFVVGLIAVILALIGFSLASTSLQQPATVCTTGTFLQTFGNGTTVCNTVPLQGTLSFFFTNQTSVNTESPSKRMLASPDSNTTVTINYPNVANNLTFQNFTTRQGLPNISLIPGGEYHIHIHANTDKSNFVMIFAEVVEVNNTGHPIAIIGTTEHEILSEIVETQLDLHFFRNETYFMNSTSSRIQVQFYAHVIQDTPGITLYFDGPTSAGLSLPSVTVDASNFVPYTGATQNVILGTNDLNANNITANNLTANNLNANNINASDLTTGTLPDARLSPNVFVDDGSESYYYNILNSIIDPKFIHYNNTGNKNISFSNRTLILSSYILDMTNKFNMTSSNAIHLVPWMMESNTVRGIVVEARTNLNGSSSNSGFVYIDLDNLSSNGKLKYYQRLKRLYNGSIVWSNISSQLAAATLTTRFMNFTSGANGALIIAELQEGVQWVAFSDSTQTFLYSGSMAGEELNTDLNGNVVGSYSGKRASTPIMLSVPSNTQIQFWIRPAGSLQDTRATIFYAQLPADW